MEVILAVGDNSSFDGAARQSSAPAEVAPAPCEWAAAYLAVFGREPSPLIWQRDAPYFGSAPFQSVTAIPREERYRVYCCLRRDLGEALAAQARRHAWTLGDLIAGLVWCWQRACAGFTGGRVVMPRKQPGAGGIVWLEQMHLPHGVRAMTLGRSVLCTAQSDLSVSDVAHEYVHVLQQRHDPLFLFRYVRRKLRNWPPLDDRGWPSESHAFNPYEVAAYKVEYYYRWYGSWLPPLWELPLSANARPRGDQ